MEMRDLDAELFSIKLRVAFFTGLGWTLCVFGALYLGGAPACAIALGAPMMLGGAVTLKAIAETEAQRPKVDGGRE